MDSIFIFIFFIKESIPLFKINSFLSDQTGRSRPAAPLTPETFCLLSSVFCHPASVFYLLFADT